LRKTDNDPESLVQLEVTMTNHDISVLVETVRAILAESGESEFDADAFVGRWPDVRQPALGGELPRAWLERPGGLDELVQLLRRQQASAYA
jgi:hypothetical protein